MLVYRKGDFKVICDLSGETHWRSECRFTWDNLLVYKDYWYPREAQDFIRAVADDQRVPDPRPDIITTQGETTVKVAAARNATTIDLGSVTGIGDNDSLGITLDGYGGIHWTFSDGTPVGDTVTLGSYLPAAAAAGNVVYLPSINPFTWITP